MKLHSLSKIWEIINFNKSYDEGEYTCTLESQHLEKIGLLIDEIFDMLAEKDLKISELENKIKQLEESK